MSRHHKKMSRDIRVLGTQNYGRIAKRCENRFARANICTDWARIGVVRIGSGRMKDTSRKFDENLLEHKRKSGESV